MSIKDCGLHARPILRCCPAYQVISTNQKWFLLTPYHVVMIPQGHTHDTRTHRAVRPQMDCWTLLPPTLYRCVSQNLPNTGCMAMLAHFWKNWKNLMSSSQPANVRRSLQGLVLQWLWRAGMLWKTEVLEWLPCTASTSRSYWAKPSGAAVIVSMCCTAYNNTSSFWGDACQHGSNLKNSLEVRMELAARAAVC